MDVVAVVVVVVALAVAVVVVSFPCLHVAEACAHSFVPRRSRPLFLGQHVGEESGNRRAEAEGSLGAMGRTARCESWKEVVGGACLTGGRVGASNRYACLRFVARLHCVAELVP